MYDISAIGLSMRLIASRTLPTGITITEFADDSDPFDLPSMDIATPAMNINGDLVVFSAPTPIQITINLIAGSQADENLAIIFDANRPGRNKRHAGDIITLVKLLPDGGSLSLTDGKIISGTPGISVTSGGRYKAKTYGFAFQGLSRTRSNTLRGVI